MVGWSTDSSNNGNVYFPNDLVMLENDLILYAQWQLLDNPSTGDIVLDFSIVILMIFASGNLIVLNKKKKSK